MSINQTKLYIIDDNAAVCDALQFLFDSHTLTVTIYQDPLLFLEEFSPDWEGCLIIDLFMPSMNGIDLMKKLKELNSHLKIIVMSGHGTEDAAAESLASGADAFITKPFKTENLLNQVMHFLRA